MLDSGALRAPGFVRPHTARVRDYEAAPTSPRHTPSSVAPLPPGQRPWPVRSRWLVPRTTSPPGQLHVGGGTLAMAHAVTFGHSCQHGASPEVVVPFYPDFSSVSLRPGGAGVAAGVGVRLRRG